MSGTFFDANKLGGILKRVPLKNYGAKTRSVPLAGSGIRNRHIFPGIVHEDIEYLGELADFVADDYAWSSVKPAQRKALIPRLLDVLADFITALQDPKNQFITPDPELQRLIDEEKAVDGSATSCLEEFLQIIPYLPTNEDLQKIRVLFDAGKKDKAWHELQLNLVVIIPIIHRALLDDATRLAASKTAIPEPPDDPPEDPDIPEPTFAVRATPAVVSRSAKVFAKNSAYQKRHSRYSTQDTDQEEIFNAITGLVNDFKNKSTKGMNKKGHDLTGAPGPKSFYTEAEQKQNKEDIKKLYVDTNLAVKQETYGAGNKVLNFSVEGGARNFMQLYGKHGDYAIVLSAEALQFRTPEELAKEEDNVVLASSALAAEVRREQVKHLGKDRSAQFLVIDLVDGVDADGKPKYFAPDPNNHEHAIALLAGARKFMDEGGTMPIFKKPELECIENFANSADTRKDQIYLAYTMLNICGVLYGVDTTGAPTRTPDFTKVTPEQFEEAQLTYAEYVRLPNAAFAEDHMFVKAGILPPRASDSSRPQSPKSQKKWATAGATTPAGRAGGVPGSDPTGSTAMPGTGVGVHLGNPSPNPLLITVPSSTASGSPAYSGGGTGTSAATPLSGIVAPIASRLQREASELESSGQNKDDINKHLYKEIKNQYGLVNDEHQSAINKALENKDYTKAVQIAAKEATAGVIVGPPRKSRST